MNTKHKNQKIANAVWYNNLLYHWNKFYDLHMIFYQIRKQHWYSNTDTRDKPSMVINVYIEDD